MNRKIILTDVDGTLVPYHDTEPPVSVLEAVDQLHANGHQVFMITGRTLPHINGRLKEIPFDGMIGGNGAFIRIKDQIIKQKCLPDADTAAITDYLDAHHLEYFIETIYAQYGSHHFETRAVSALETYGLKNPVIRKVYPQMHFPESLHVSQVTKINYILNSYEDYLDVKAHFPQFRCMTWGGTGESALFGDIAQKGIDKNLAVGELLEYLQVPREDTYGFGDAEVDIPLFEACGHSVCMGDGRQAAKDAAEYITDPAGEDGWKHACEHFGLI